MKIKNNLNGQSPTNNTQQLGTKADLTQLTGMSTIDQQTVSFLFNPTNPVAGTVTGYIRHGLAQLLSNGTFHFVRVTRERHASVLIQKLRHGRVSLTRMGKIYLTLTVDAGEPVDPSNTLFDECRQAAVAVEDFLLGIAASLRKPVEAITPRDLERAYASAEAESRRDSSEDKENSSEDKENSFEVEKTNSLNVKKNSFEAEKAKSPRDEKTSSEAESRKAAQPATQWGEVLYYQLKGHGSDEAEAKTNSQRSESRNAEDPSSEAKSKSPKDKKNSFEFEVEKTNSLRDKETTFEVETTKSRNAKKNSFEVEKTNSLKDKETTFEVEETKSRNAKVNSFEVEKTNSQNAKENSFEVEKTNSLNAKENSFEVEKTNGLNDGETQSEIPFESESRRDGKSSSEPESPKAEETASEAEGRGGERRADRIIYFNIEAKANGFVAERSTTQPTGEHSTTTASGQGQTILPYPRTTGLGEGGIV